MRIKLYFDGACNNLGNPPLMGIGVAVWINGERREDLDKAFCGGVGTNNVAEYMALIAALKVAASLREQYKEKIESIKIFGDSQIIIKQMSGEYACSKDHLMKLLKEAKDCRSRVKRRVEIGWIPRAQNTEADKRSKQGILGEQLI